jgi:dienelactone hydrolase
MGGLGPVMAVRLSKCQNPVHGRQPERRGNEGMMLRLKATAVVTALTIFAAARAGAGTRAPGEGKPAAMIPAGTGIFEVDATTSPLPDLLEEGERQRLQALFQASPGPAYKIDSPLSPDDRTILASHKGERFFLDVRTGQMVPVAKPEKPVSVFSPFVWLDEDRVGFITLRKGDDKETRAVGASFDRRTGETILPEPRLELAASRLGDQKVLVMLSEDAGKLLVADTSNAKPMKMPGAPRMGGASGRATYSGFDPIPALVAMGLTEGTKLSVVDVRTGVSHAVFTIGPDVKILDVAFSRDGNWLSITSESLGDSMHRMFDGANLTEDEYKDSVGTLAPADNVFFQSNQVTVFDFGRAKLSTLRAADGDGLVYTGTHWSPDGRTMVAEMAGPGRLAGRRYPQYLGDSRSGGALVFYDTRLREIDRLERPEVDSPIKDARFISNEELIIQTRFGTNGHPYLYDRTTRSLRNLADRPGAYYDVTATRGTREILFVYASFTDAPEYARAGLDGTGFTRLTSLNRVARDATQTLQHPVSFTLGNGERIDGVMVLPAGVGFPPRNLPIVVWQPGGPFNAVTNTWDATVETPASLLPNFGFGVLVTPLYGRHGFGHARFHAIADNENFGRADIDAQAAIAAQLRERGWAGKIGIVGCSYGGYFVTQSLVRHSDTYDAGHSMCSIVDWVTEWTRGGGQGAPWLIGKPIFDDPQAYIDVSPAYNARKIRTPLLAFHGTEDFVPLTAMDNLMYQVIAAGTPARMLRFRGASHGFANTSPAELSRAYELYGAQEQVRWFRTYLGR